MYFTLVWLTLQKNMYKVSNASWIIRFNYCVVCYNSCFFCLLAWASGACFGINSSILLMKSVFSVHPCLKNANENEIDFKPFSSIYLTKTFSTTTIRCIFFLVFKNIPKKKTKMGWNIPCIVPPSHSKSASSPSPSVSSNQRLSEPIVSLLTNKMKN